MKKCGIYKIISPTGRVYIGESKDINRRWKEYLNKTCKNQPRLKRSFEKHGIENHIFEIIEECVFEDLICRERFWQDRFNVLGENGLNCLLSKCGEEKQILSVHSRNKLSIKMLGTKNHRFGTKISETTRLKLKNIRKNTKIAEDNPMWGKTGLKNPCSKIVLCTNTGIFYYGLPDVKKYFGYSIGHLSYMLSGKKPNKTTLIYC